MDKFCSRCQEFWSQVISRAEIPEASEGPDGQSPAKIKWPRHSMILHRNMKHLKNASDSGCLTCRAIYHVPRTAAHLEWGMPGLPGEDEDVNIVLDLESEQDGALPVLRTTYVAETDDSEPKVVVPKSVLAIYGGILSDDDLAATIRHCARPENSSTGSAASLALASFWLKKCLQEHHDCADTTSSSFMPTRVLDVGDGMIKLIETNQSNIRDVDRRYLALSHCWGKIKIITTEKESFETRKEGIDPDTLSKTFRDAVEVTRTLGFRYLWIDSLCIIQDDRDDWATESEQMCHIYRDAVLTIAAAHAPGGDVGCFYERDGLVQYPFCIDLPNRAVAGDSKKSNSLHVLFQFLGRSESRLYNVEPPLYGRAWVLQEQILSSRMLIFDGPQLKWECLSRHGSERDPVGGATRHKGHLRTLQTGIREPKEFFNFPEHVSANLSHDPRYESRFQHMEWHMAVSDYTHRGMTKSSDRLIAIAGIADAVKVKTKNEYLAGLWKDELWIGLLWSVPQLPGEFLGVVSNAFDFERNEKVRHEPSLAPSWSWASVTVPVVWPDLPAVTLDYQRLCEVQSAETHGTATNMAGTVKVKGHVRIGYVNSVYPYAIREAAKTHPNMSFSKSETVASATRVTVGGRKYRPDNFFAMSSKRPTKETDWKLVRGHWRPDEMLDPQTEITFLAVSQYNATRQEDRAARSYKPGDPLEVTTIGLVPTSPGSDVYRRVGYGEWEECAWYGYMCGPYEHSEVKVSYWNDTLWKILWKVLGIRRPAWGTETCVEGKGKHHHRSDGDGPHGLPDRSAYSDKVDVEERVLHVV